MKEKYKVLIVDDDDETVCKLKKILEQEVYQVEMTQSANNAFEIVKIEKYHIVLIDVDMPEMGGIELLKEIKRYDALSQIIMMTENSTMDKILSSLEYGANDYMIKPFESDEKVIKIIDYSIDKLERWRQSIIEIVK